MTRGLQALAVALGLVLLGGAALAADADDITKVGGSARQLGLGRAFFALADDPAAVFTNPAGLGQIKNFELNTLTAKHLDSYDVLALDLALPLANGGVGFGLAANSLTYAPTTGATSGVSRLAMLVSYGTGDNFLIKDLSAGVNVKLFNSSLTRPGLGDLTATGLESDLGVIYRYLPQLKLGFTQQNFLPASAGGRLKWSDGVEEGFPTVSRIGLAYKLLGREAQVESPQELLFALDYEKALTAASPSGLVHAGVEWTPVALLTLRGGLDQGEGVNETINNLAFGLGLNLSGFRFDYAYHTYANDPSLTSHYFSIAYRPEIKPTVVRKECIALGGYQAITFAEIVTLEGAVDPAVARLTVLGAEIPISEDNKFTVTLAADPGKNAIPLAAYDNRERQLSTAEARIVRLRGFSDVPPDLWAREAIGFLALLDILGGYPDGTFRPEKPVTRAEMTKLLYTLQETAPEQPAKAPFRDVAADSWSAPFVKAAAVQGVVTGYPNGTFKPNKTISRAEGATIVAKYDRLLPVTVTAAPFPDIPGRHWAAEAIFALQKEGTLDYLRDQKFQPKKALTRAEAAGVVARTKPARAKIEPLLDFLKGEK